ncbi:hypothetical protein [Legionella jamestowniensis]|uniref:Lipoprotein n=1 Tax=Legionella jamestowniensis TaxID=455 RepID=A0A0W0UI72_9GAMM|nr:hypothetical protein [Legionella jamestowniensis]KTD07598.1 hypothetical protein Ljam_1793 [Legionella jamestowniensis]OCH99346.1 hypothetical protein A8135_06565 [Legionella jamestowniensis]SFL59180.1 hypothetical protein SAMN02746073_0911 [Legionella jamestowniensis DSM 19215]
MKKNLLFWGIAGILTSSSLLLTGCQGIEQLFTDSPVRSSQPEYGTSQRHNTTIYQSGSSTRANSTTSRATSSSTSANRSNPDSSSSSGTSSSSSSASSSTSTPATTQAAKKTAGTAVPLEAPTVGQ